MLEPEEFEFYEYLTHYKELFGEFPPTHNLPENVALKMIKKAIEERIPIPKNDGTEIK